MDRGLRPFPGCHSARHRIATAGPLFSARICRCPLSVGTVLSADAVLSSGTVVFTDAEGLGTGMGLFDGIKRRDFLAKAMAAGGVGALAAWANPIIERAHAA